MSRRLKKITIIIIATSLALLLYTYMESRWIKINHIEIASSDIPDSFNDARVIFISDIHHGPYFSKRRVRKLLERINALEADIIILGGDYVQRNPKYIRPFFDEAKNLSAELGVYGVLGNHDHWEDKALTRKLMLEAKINICDNESFWINNGRDSIKIGGVGDLWEDSQILKNTTFDLKEDDFSILISHNPDYFDHMNTELIDLAVAGHTHGGQITFFGQWAPVLPTESGNRYRYGLIERNLNYLYITSGVGTVTPPLRFFCRPEIAVFNLVKE